jgi:hypothetical protein
VFLDKLGTIMIFVLVVFFTFFFNTVCSNYSKCFQPWFNYGCSHTNTYHKKCNQHLVFHVSSFKNYNNVASFEFFCMMPFLMFYRNITNNLNLI